MKGGATTNDQLAAHPPTLVSNINIIIVIVDNINNWPAMMMDMMIGINWLP